MPLTGSKTTESLEGVPAITWSLRAPGASGTWKEYRIMVIDRFSIIGFGTLGKFLQYQVVEHPSIEHARTFALGQTAKKERGGYQMYILPRQRAAQMGSRDWLRGLVGQRGFNPSLSNTTTLALEQGEPL
jgi:hypothetical protein